MIELAVCLVLAILFGILAVAVRRLLRPRRKRLEATVIEIDAEGIWKQTDRSRFLLLQACDVHSADVYRGDRNKVLRVVIKGVTRKVSIDGLWDMSSFLSDVQCTFPHAKVAEHAEP